MAASWNMELERSTGELGSPGLEHFLSSPEDTQSIGQDQQDQMACDVSLRSSDVVRENVILVDDVGYEVDDVSYEAVKDSTHSNDLEETSDLCSDNDEVSPAVPSGDELTGVRKSERGRREKRAYSPSLMSPGKKKKKRKLRHGSSSAKQLPPRPYDKGPDGQPFSCALCKSPYICHPARRRTQSKRSKHQPVPRHKMDANGKLLILCNACGLAYDRKRKPAKVKVQPSQEEKEKYLDEAKTFAMSLVQGLNDPDAERLSCPNFKVKPCGCMQRYIIGEVGDGQMEESRKRASDLLQLLKEAKRLSQQKCYSVDNTLQGKKVRLKNIGLGNGQKRSRDFEEFVLRHRKLLREDLKFCERAAQRVLMYSNNFLHKKLKTETRQCRAERVKGKAALGLLTRIDQLPKQRCCVDNCVTLAVTHNKLLTEWQQRATSGQTEARRVLAEMLTPSGGAIANCYRFISWVTGCSHSTIGSVNDQMKRTGGDREPPLHGLRKYWASHPKRSNKEDEDHCDTQSGSESEVESPTPVLSDAAPSPSTSSSDIMINNIGTTANLGAMVEVPQPAASPGNILSQSAITTVQLQFQRQQLLNIQKQLAQQQLQLQQQQQLLQHQILQQVLLQQQAWQQTTSDVQVPVMAQNLQRLLGQQQQIQQAQQAMQAQAQQVQQQTDESFQDAHTQVTQQLQLAQMLESLNPRPINPSQQQQVLQTLLPSSEPPKTSACQEVLPGLRATQAASPQHTIPTCTVTPTTVTKTVQASTTLGQAAQASATLGQAASASTTLGQAAQASVTLGQGPTNPQHLVQQILELSQAGGGSTTITLPTAQVNNILAQLQDCASGEISNVNVTLLQQNGASATETTAQCDQASADLLGMSNLGPVNYVVIHQSQHSPQVLDPSVFTAVHGDGQEKAGDPAVENGTIDQDVDTQHSALSIAASDLTQQLPALLDTDDITVPKNS